MSFPPVENVGSLIGPAIGLQAASGTLFFWLVEGYLVFSRDYGATWRTSALSRISRSECSIAFAQDPSNETIYMNCRRGSDHRRGQTYWRPDGLGSFVSDPPTYPEEFTDPGCQGSVISAGGGTLYTSNAGSTGGRSNMTIHASHDAGATWTAGKLVSAGPSAYSQLVSLGDRLGLLFEAGVHWPYETISWTTLELTTLRKQVEQVEIEEIMELEVGTPEVVPDLVERRVTSA